MSGFDIVIVIWLAVLTVLVLYVVAAYLWHINVTHRHAPLPRDDRLLR